MGWKCPNCHQALSKKTPQQYVCPTGHSFDRAKQGYINLLLDQHKQSKTPGDDQIMLSARRRFLSAGFYRPLIEAILPHAFQNTIIADLGCGEGYYLGQLFSKLPKTHLCTGYGIDISKTGVRMAAAKYHTPAMHFAVGNTFHVPMLDQSVDLAFSVFAPFAATEVFRILKPGGVLIRIAPGLLHLKEIKEKLYSKATEHQPPAPLDLLTLVDSQRLTWTQLLENNVLNEDLIPMTPLNYQGSIEAKAALKLIASMNVTFDFCLEVLSR